MTLLVIKQTALTLKGKVCGNAVNSSGTRWECKVAHSGLFQLLCVFAPIENNEIDFRLFCSHMRPREYLEEQTNIQPSKEKKSQFLRSYKLSYDVSRKWM